MRVFLFILMCAFGRQAVAQQCPIRSDVFQSGEELRFKVYYNWGFIWASAAEVVFKAVKENYKGRTCYHFTGVGSTYPKYDWFFKVRDRFESYADTSSLRPYRYIRDGFEGSQYTYNDYVFNYKNNKLYTGIKHNKEPLKLDSTSLVPCAVDVMTGVYYARCLDFSSYKVNDTIPIQVAMDNRIFPMRIRYVGKGVYKNDELKESFNCIKFKVLLIEGYVFNAGENMTVWVTDDKNRMPVYVESEISIGTIKVMLMGYKGLRNKVESKVADKPK